ncbi:MAG: ABC transporter substrate-binding protein [Candidatus Binatia bacterium]
MEKVHFPYRSESHLALIHVVAESGSWEKHGLEVKYEDYILPEDAHQGVANGSVEFVSGNHVSTYAMRTRGDKWVYLGQTVNLLSHRLAVKADSGISKVSDLRGKVVGTKGTHPSLNSWLFLKQQGLDTDRGDVKLQKVGGGMYPAWQSVREGKVDAAFVTVPEDLFAQRMGLKVIDVEGLPMVFFSTISSGLSFVEKHSAIVDRFLRGMIEGIAFFKNHKEESVKIIQSKYKGDGELDSEAAAHLYHALAGVLVSKLYPTLKAISNVYEEAVRLDKAAENVEPVALWDFHHLRRIDDSGFIDKLYAD